MKRPSSRLTPEAEGPEAESEESGLAADDGGEGELEEDAEGEGEEEGAEVVMRRPFSTPTGMRPTTLSNVAQCCGI